MLLNLGASYGPYMRRGEVWRLVMPMFLHGGWLHILGNSYALYILGPILERVYGYARYLTIYVAAGVGGASLSMTVSRDVSVGASGAIFGVAGAMLVPATFIATRFRRAGDVPSGGELSLSSSWFSSQGFWNMASTIGATWVDWPRVHCWRSSFRPHGASFRTESLLSLHRKPWWHFPWSWWFLPWRQQQTITGLCRRWIASWRKRKATGSAQQFDADSGPSSKRSAWLLAKSSRMRSWAATT